VLSDQPPTTDTCPPCELFLPQQAASLLLSDANEAIERITKYSARLVEVRQRRVTMAAALSAAEAEAAAAAGASGALDQDDLVSEAPSMISGFSIYTDRTSAGATGIGGSSAASSHAASTIGGRKPMRGSKKAAKKGLKGKKIKAGTPGEEAGLEAHLLTLTPAKHVLEEAGQLSELLVMLQHTLDATKLQQRVGQWQAAAAEAVALVAQGQQQQPAASNAAGDHSQQLMAAAAASAAAATAAAADVRWKWDVLREHKA
jgi:elongator complex protein 1